jgi:hypothetical protein
MSITRLWLSILPLQEEITIIPPELQFISQGLRNFSMPAYHGKEQNVSMPTYVIFCIPASISYILASISQVSGLRYISLLAYQVTKWYLKSQVFQYAGISWQRGKCQYAGISWQRAKCQYASISWQEPNFSMPTYHGIDQNPQSPFISVRQHIKASINNSYHRLFRLATISRHSVILSVIANSGTVIYRDINLKANKYHISYRIRFHRVSRFSILTCLIILHINKCPVLAQPKRHISIPALSKQTMSMRHSLRGKVSI